MSVHQPTINHPPLMSSIAVTAVATIVFALGAGATTYSRSVRLSECTQETHLTVDAPVHVTNINDRLTASYFLEKGYKEAEAEFQLTATSREGLRSGDRLSVTPRLLRSEDGTSRFESRYLSASATVRSGLLSVVLCVDAASKSDLSGGTYTGVLTIGDPAEATIDVPVEVNYRSRWAAIYLVITPIIGFLAAWALVRGDEASPFLSSWYMLFAAGTIGGTVGWFAFISASEGFQAFSFAPLVGAMWAGATAAGAFISGLTKNPSDK